MIKTAKQAELVQTHFDRRSGRLRIKFSVDGVEHVVHALYHDPPDLPQQTWDRCIGELAVACLVDISTTVLSKSVMCRAYNPGARGKEVFLAATDALRLEVLSDNALPMRLLLQEFKTGASVRYHADLPNSKQNRVMLLMGGGKDSLYTYHILRRAGYEVHCFYVTEARRTWQRLRRVYAAFEGKAQQYRVYLDVNRRKALEENFNGCYLSQFQIGQFVAAALPYALANRCRYIALGIERSADDPMRRYHGRAVNHQHQKSSIFLRLLNKHLHARFKGLVQIISPIQSLYDFGIYARFLQLERSIIELQSSCGSGSSKSAHCGQCSKCVFLASLFVGISSDRSLYAKLFSKDPLKNPQLLQEWLSDDDERPLTCAGHKDEVKLALLLAHQRGWNNIAPNVRKLHFHDIGVDAILRHYLNVHAAPILPLSIKKRIIPLLQHEGKLAGRNFVI